MRHIKSHHPSGIAAPAAVSSTPVSPPVAPAAPSFQSPVLSAPSPSYQPVASTSYAAFPASIPSPAYNPDVAMTDSSLFAPQPSFLPQPNGVEAAFPQASHEPSPDIFGERAFDLGLSADVDADMMLRTLLDDTLLANMPARATMDALNWSRPPSPIVPAPSFDFDALETLFGRARRKSTGSAEATSPAAIEQKLRDRERAGLDSISALWPRVRGTVSAETMAAPKAWASAFDDLNGIQFETIEPPSTLFLASAISAYFRHHAIESPLFIAHTFDPQHRAPILVCVSERVAATDSAASPSLRPARGLWPVPRPSAGTRRSSLGSRLCCSATCVATRARTAEHAVVGALARSARPHPRGHPRASRMTGPH